MCLLKLLWYFLYLCWDEPHLAPFIRSEWPVMFWTTRALTMQRYQNGHRIFDTLLTCGDDFDLLFGGKNAGRILTLLVREIELSEHVETAPRTERCAGLDPSP